MSKHQDCIQEFMDKIGQNCPDFPEIPSLEERKLRAELIMEEAYELINKGLGLTMVLDTYFGNLEFKKRGRCFVEHNIGPNLMEIADGCADLSVVTIGTLCACGISDDRLLEEVDANNLEKFGPGHTIREDGKLIKPPNHQPPDIKKVLLDQLWDESK